MTERSLGAWLGYLEALHPREIDLGLERVAAVAQRLDLIPFPVPTITVAGTNGKGSVAHTADALLASLGRCSGRYTSPHLTHFAERITVAGVPADDADIAAAFSAIEAARADTSLSYFEFATLAALHVMRLRGVDSAVLEVGLGGRLDAVNIVDAQVGVITAIALDHQEWLGSTLEAIGAEKAGIARPDQPVVLAERSYPDSVAAALRERGARPLLAGQDWDWQSGASGGTLTLHSAAGLRYGDLPVPSGLREANVAAALQAVELLHGSLPPAAEVADTLRNLHVPGRRQRLTVADRELVLDVAHNPAAMQSLANWLRRQPAAGQTYAALGLMADKDLPAMAATLAPAVSGAMAVALPAVARAQSAERIWQVLDSLGVAVSQSEFTVEAVWANLLQRTRPGDRIVFCGSFHTVAGIMSALDYSAFSPVTDDNSWTVS